MGVVNFRPTWGQWFSANMVHRPTAGPRHGVDVLQGAVVRAEAGAVCERGYGGAQPRQPAGP